MSNSNGKLVAMLVMRNRGYGIQRLTEFSEEYDKIVEDIKNRDLTMKDIRFILEEETGINLRGRLE